MEDSNKRYKVATRCDKHHGIKLLSRNYCGSFNMTHTNTVPKNFMELNLISLLILFWLALKPLHPLHQKERSSPIKHPPSCFIPLLNLKVNESRYIALFVVSGSINKLFSTDHVNIYLSSIFFQDICLVEKCQYLSFLDIIFNRFFPVENSGVTPH